MRENSLLKKILGNLSDIFFEKDLKLRKMAKKYQQVFWQEGLQFCGFYEG